MINRGIFDTHIKISIGSARQLWRVNDKNPGIY